MVFGQQSIYPVLLWPLHALSRVFLVHVISDQHKHYHNFYNWSWHDSSVIFFPDFFFCFVEYVRDGTNGFVGDLDAKISKNFCDFLWKTFGVEQDN